MTELGAQLGMNKNTVERHLDLLEKAYVLYSRRGFSRNLCKETTESRRYYFYDNRIRNGLVSNFNALLLRFDVGALRENYVPAERLKCNLYIGPLAESSFWRTYDRQETDLVEEWGGHLSVAEVKWSPRSEARAPLIPTVGSGSYTRVIIWISSPQRTGGPHTQKTSPSRRWSQSALNLDSLGSSVQITLSFNLHLVLSKCLHQFLSVMSFVRVTASQGRQSMNSSSNLTFSSLRRSG